MLRGSQNNLIISVAILKNEIEEDGNSKNGLVKVQLDKNTSTSFEFITIVLWHVFINDKLAIQ